jgi:hypothetical protein
MATTTGISEQNIEKIIDKGGASRMVYAMSIDDSYIQGEAARAIGNLALNGILQ